MAHKCPVDSCEYTTDSNRGLSIHFTQSHPNKEYDFTNKTEFICPQCGNVFEDYHSRRSSKEEKNNFCSKDCQNEYQQGDGLHTNCATCGDDVYVPPSHTTQVGGYEQRNHFCDKQCESVFKTKEWRGENHPSYDGGRLKLLGPNWHDQRKKALKRDNHECQKCGMTQTEHKDKHDQELHVHHRVPRKQILSDDPTTEEFVLANSLHNLQTLCVSCHKKEEQK